MYQTTIFDQLYPQYKITKPIRLIELFAGYGSQALALKYLGVKFEHWKICEWAVKSIQAYKDIHFSHLGNWIYMKVDYDLPDEYKNYAHWLYDLGISQNYNEPMTLEQIEKLGKDKQKEILANIQITNNLVNIQRVHAKDLGIENTDKYTYLLTYSFPCQDLSLAGKGKGMSDTSTRSGMLWEVERILSECNELGELPQILLMENVPQIHSQDNIKDFNKWQLRLEELGYKNYFEDLIATDYEIPQTRNRCFMVSILGDYSYTFPQKKPLKLKLKDMLEEEVDEKYFLSEKTIKFFYENEKKQQEKGNGFKFGVSDGNTIAKTITTRAGSRMDDNFIKIKNNTKKGYIKAVEGDGIDFSQPNSKTRRGRVQKNKIQTLTTQNNLGVVNSDLRIRKLTPKECFRLMGVKDEDFKKVSKNQSNSSLYHLAGDSIVVNVLMAIFKELIDRKDSDR